MPSRPPWRTVLGLYMGPGRQGSLFQTAAEPGLGLQPAMEVPLGPKKPLRPLGKKPPVPLGPPRVTMSSTSAGVRAKSMALLLTGTCTPAVMSA